MAARYWVGGTASWDGTAGTKWALTSGGAGGQTVPTAADDVFFDAASGVNTITITATANAKSITCTGFTGTLAGSIALNVAGSITLSTGMTFNYSGSITITATGTLITAGKIFNGPVNFNATGGTLTLGDAFTSSSNLLISNGTFTTSASNYAVQVGNFTSTSGTRTIQFNGSTITITGTFQCSATGLTMNAGTSTINLTTNSNSFIGAGQSYNTVSFTGNGQYPNHLISNDNGGTVGTIATLAFATAAAAGVARIALGGNLTATTLAASGGTAVNRLFFKSSTPGVQRTLTATTWTVIGNTDFQDIACVPSRTGTRLGDCGNNTGITFPAAKTVYWNLAGSNNWSATGWATTSGGTPAVNNFPLPQDTVIFDNTGAGSTVIIDSSWNIGTLNASARTSALTLIFSASYPLSMYGNFTLGSGITTSGSGITFFAGRSVTQTITTAGKNIPFEISVNAVGGTVQLLDAYSTNANAAAAIDLAYGTLNLNGFTVTTSGTGSGFSAMTGGTKTLAMGAGGTLLIQGSFGFAYTSTGTVSGTGTISLTRSIAKTFDGGGKSYAGITLNQGGAGALTVVGSNTFGDITNTYAATGATSILFTAGTTSTFSNWSASGQAGRLLTIGSVTAASHTLSKASGAVVASYLSISRSTATGGATWTALASTNGGNNTGWSFAQPGNFLTFFI